MGADQKARTEAQIHVENVGGIDEADVTFSQGLTVLEGRNATNRSSLLQAMMAACGSNNVSIKGDADEARVTLAIEGETFARTLRRNGGSIEASGEPYHDDPSLADLFAFLIESNEARQAVARGGDLREIIMRPVDSADIEAEIESLVRDRREIESELQEIDSLKDKLPELEQERTRLETRIEAKREELDEKRDELDALDADVEAKREGKQEFEEKLNELRDMRTQFDEVRYDLETEKESLEALERKEADIREEASELPEAPAEELQEIESQIERMRSRKQAIETAISELQSIIQFNEEMLEEPQREFMAVLNDEEADDGGSVTDGLLEDDRSTCWTCGSEVETEQIQKTVDALGELNVEKLDDMRDAQGELDELKDRQRTLEKKQRRQDRIERDHDRIEEQIDAREASIDRLRARRDELSDRIEDVEAEVGDLEDESYSEVLDLHKELNQLKYDLGRVESDYERVRDEIDSIEARMDEREALESEREAIQEEITDLRTRIERIAEQAVSEFNGHIDTVLDFLQYENLERIWLEGVEREVKEGRRMVTKNAFELHVVRSTASGATYEDTVDHLSESEREVTGLVFALAGYLAHDVHEKVPFLLLDSLEAIDGERIAKLIEYFASYPDHLIVTLLPEDASHIEYEHQRITEI